MTLPFRLWAFARRASGLGDPEGAGDRVAIDGVDDGEAIELDAGGAAVGGGVWPHPTATMMVRHTRRLRNLRRPHSLVQPDGFMPHVICNVKVSRGS